MTASRGHYRVSLLLILWASLAVPAPDTVAPTEKSPFLPGSDDGEFGGPELIFQQQDQPELVTPDTTGYNFYIADLESRQGPYAPGLSEQLLGLGLSYQAQGLHDEAVKTFKRGVHIARINNGLNAGEQIVLLQAMIQSLTSTGQFELADDRQTYLYRVQRSVYGDASSQMAAAMLQRADWERQAYYLALGDSSFTRLLTMWELYGSVLSNIAKRETQHSPNLIEPLLGLLQTQYMIADYSGEARPEYSAGSSADMRFVEQNRFSGLRATNYRRGQAVLGALREVYAYNEEVQSPLAAQVLVQLGDWHTWHDKDESALLAYQQAWDELAALEAGEKYLHEAFSNRVLLPDVSGLRRNLIRPGGDAGEVEVSYYIDQRGRARDLEVLQLEPRDASDEREPIQLLRSIKYAQFRPLFEAREPVATEAIIERYAY